MTSISGREPQVARTRLLAEQCRRSRRTQSFRISANVCEQGKRLSSHEIGSAPFSTILIGRSRSDSDLFSTSESSSEQGVEIVVFEKARRLTYCIKPKRVLWSGIYGLSLKHNSSWITTYEPELYSEKPVAKGGSFAPTSKTNSTENQSGSKGKSCPFIGSTKSSHKSQSGPLERSS